MLRKGDKAPKFSLYSDQLEPVSLHAYSGKPVLLLFYPLSFMDETTAFFEAIQTIDFTQYHPDIQLLGISVDAPYCLGRYKAMLQLYFPLLSDFNRVVSRQYGVLYETFPMDLMGVTKKAAILIDPHLVIRHLEVLDSPSDLPNFVQIGETLAEL